MIPNSFRGMNFDLGETADALREMVARFTTAEIAPRADEIDKANIALIRQHFPILDPVIGRYTTRPTSNPTELRGSFLHVRKSSE